ncbi:MAG: hypothetical protein Q3X05_02445, partial [Bilophila sp.]|nr:hypothetical protein [Bilophila sp.]
HPVGHEESEKDDDEEMKRESERERERSNRAGACLKTALHRQPLPSPFDPAGLPGGGAISGGRIGI